MIKQLVIRWMKRPRRRGNAISTEIFGIARASSRFVTPSRFDKFNGERK